MAKTKEVGLKIVEKLRFSKYNNLSELSQELQCLLAVGYLGGKSQSVYTEDIAFQLWKWLPHVFGWNLEKYNYPDKQMPKRGLSYLRTYEWLAGGFNEVVARDGWKLTGTGADVYEMISYLHDQNIDKNISKKDQDYLKRKIQNTELFKKFIIEGDSLAADYYKICEFLEIMPGNKPLLRVSFFNLLIKAKNINNKNFIRFLELLKLQNKDILDEGIYAFESRQNKPKEKS